MKARGIVGVLAGVLLLVSALAHAFLGWPVFDEALAAAGVDGQLVGALAVGWHFGSTSMAAFGVIVLLTAKGVLSGRKTSLGPARVIAVAYLLFGTSAFLLRNMNPHFLLFVVTGVLVGVLAFPKASASDG